VADGQIPLEWRWLEFRQAKANGKMFRWDRWCRLQLPTGEVKGDMKWRFETSDNLTTASLVAATVRAS
jgi:hypothetical protein